MRIYSRSYGMDDLNKALLIIAFGLSFIDLFARNVIVYSLSMIVFVILLFRFFSTKKFQRSEENRKYRHFVKYIQLKWTHRKTHKVYKCKNCGQFIRVPKGQGKIETTCPKCGNKEIHKS